jgi:hypoxanthine phosphoribosyltransferase
MAAVWPEDCWLAIMDIIFGVAGFLVGVFGLIASIYYGKEAARLNREKRRFSWEDLQTGARELARTINKTFKPDIIYTLSPRGGIIVYLSISEIGEDIPVYVGIQEDVRFGKFRFVPKDYDVVGTAKWNNYIPPSIWKEPGLKVLVIDDYAMSGDSLVNIVSHFISKGFRRENIKTATLVCSSNAIQGNKRPDYHYFTISDPTFYFPWGSAK